MRLLSSIRNLAGSAPLAIALTAGAALPAPGKVESSSLAVDAAGAPIHVPALLFRPVQAAPDATIPLVVALHGCGGMFSTRRGSESTLSDSFAQWTGQLLDDGFAVLWRDSFTPRGQREVCTIKMGERTVNAAARAVANDRVRACLREHLAATATVLPPTPTAKTATSTR